MRALALVGVDGTTINLDGSGAYFPGEAPALWGAPPADVSESPAPGRAGVDLLQVRHAARDAVLPVLVSADTPSEFDSAFSDLMRVIDPTRGMVRLVVTRADGSKRELSAVALAGYENLTFPAPTTAEVVVPIRLRAPDPYWRSVEEHEFQFETTAFESNAEPTVFNAPISFNAPVPFNGADADGVPILPVTIGGDVPSFPRFEAVGPATWVEAVNLRTREAWQFDAALTDGQTLVVESEPGRRSVRVNDIPAWESMSTLSKLWGLQPGRNDIAIRMLGTGTGSLLRMTIRNLWLTA